MLLLAGVPTRIKLKVCQRGGPGEVVSQLMSSGPRKEGKGGGGGGGARGGSRERATGAV